MEQLKQKIKTEIVYANPFGDQCVLKIPNDCDVVILAYNNGYGLKPISLCLPHQVYVEKIEQLIKEHQAHEIFAIPFNSDNYISIVGNVDNTREHAYAWVK